MSKNFGKRLNSFEHALLRPDTYIGSIKTGNKEMWVYEDTVVEDVTDEENKEPSVRGRLVNKLIKYNKGLTRLFIEIMSNAIDNKWRSEKNSIQMKRIDFSIDIDEESETYGWITITNDGQWIPIEKHEYEYTDARSGKVVKDSLYPAEVFFGDMLAGTNFEDDEGRKTSGRNGIGGKVAIIFSHKFIIEHTDPENQLKFYQSYGNNGKVRSVPKVTSYKAKSAYTKILWLPDYERFDYPGMDEDLFSLLKKHVYECAMITGLTVTLNGEKIVVKDLSKYARLCYPDTQENKIHHFKAPNGDECVVVERGMAEMDLLENVPHLSWVNGINTLDGGLHVEVWQDQIFSSLTKAFNARKPKKGEKTILKTTAKELYPYFLIVVRSEVADAKFDSQTKDKLTAPDILLASTKEEKAELSNVISEGIKKMLKWNFITLLDEKLLAKSERAQNKKDGVKKKLIIDPKNARDAYYAGTKESSKCSLFITEGLSAKQFADRLIAGIQDGSNYYGSFAIRGKFINVQKSSTRDVVANTEVKSLKTILGLIQGKVYTDLSELRYGKVLFMTDQDDDGFHIRGLLLNFFWHFWPSLFSLGVISVNEVDHHFLSSFSTMVVKADWGAGAKKQTKIFYSNPEYKQWYEQSGHKIKGLATKYYKGLGSHRPGDEHIYLNDQKILNYVIDGEEDKYMALGFMGTDREQTDMRKEWITSSIQKPDEVSLIQEEESITVDGLISVSDFVKTQLIIYHKMALSRALPSIWDGMKNGQRKALYGILKTAGAKKTSINIENLTGAVKQITGYHHAGSALEDTIKNMAQGFVGSNNMPLLDNDGNFGSRYYGGADSSQARYISTAPEDITKTVFHPDDIPLLDHEVDEDGNNIEYKYYMPVVPIVLINGAEGIATGYSSKVPCYNPEDVVDRIRIWLDSEDGEIDAPPMIPWYRGFNGKIELMIKKDKKYEVWDGNEEKPVAWRCTGILEKGEKGWWHIKEVPVDVWPEKVEVHIAMLANGGETKKNKKVEKKLLDARWTGSPNTPTWEIKPTKDFTPDIDVAGNFKILQKMNSLTNMHLLDENGYPRKFDSPEDILKVFCAKRLEYYDMRRDYWIDYWTAEYTKENSRYKFVKAVVDKKLNMHQEDQDLETSMVGLGLVKVNDNFDYLLSMQMRSMTVKRLEEIKKEIERVKAKLDELTSKTSKDIWREDLDSFLGAWEKFQKTRCEEKTVINKKKIILK